MHEIWEKEVNIRCNRWWKAQESNTTVYSKRNFRNKRKESNLVLFQYLTQYQNTFKHDFSYIIRIVQLPLLVKTHCLSFTKTFTCYIYDILLDYYQQNTSLEITILTVHVVYHWAIRWNHKKLQTTTIKTVYNCLYSSKHYEEW